MKFLNDSDYVEFYARELREDNKIFEQQKIFIEDQFKASSSLFKNKFGKDFKKNARIYLKQIGLIK